MANELDVCETHLSRLFFTPDRVYKSLKPVCLPFFDARSAADRCALAAVEYEANRALAPDVYLGLADVVERGELVDRMIVMRRLADNDELTNVLGTDGEVAALRDVARHLAVLHGSLPPLSGADAQPATLETVTKNWQDNLDAIGPFAGSVIANEEFAEVAQLAGDYTRGRADLFASRIEQGWARRGHGDLRCEHVYCTSDGPRLIDCVAFDDTLRTGDVLSDVAFLAMDLHRLAGVGASITFMQHWVEFTNEHHPSSLAHFYVGYRAHVRAKVACLNVERVGERAAWDAQVHHAIARHHLRIARSRLVLVGGGPGTGKSTVAETIAGQLGAAWLRSDEVRKDLAGIAHDAHVFRAPGEGEYSPEMNDAMMSELRRRASVLLRHGFNVVLDASWRSDAERSKARALAHQLGAEMIEIRCDLPAGIAKERIARRMSSIYNPSDATPELVDHFAARFDPWPEATVLSTDRPISETLRAATDLISNAAAPAKALVVGDPTVVARQQLIALTALHQARRPA